MSKPLALISTGIGLAAFMLWLGVTGPRPATMAPDMKPDDMRPVSVSMAGRNFQIPYSYITPRPNLAQVNAENAWDLISLAFWMPNGQPVDHDMISTPTFALNDVSFRGPIDGLYIVVVRGLSSVEGKYTRPDPDIQLRNILGDGVTIPFARTQLDDKTAIYKPMKPGSNTSYEIYGQPGPDRKYLLTCTPSDVMPNPDCHGDVRFYDHGLIASIQYPIQKDMDAAAITAKLGDLLASWANPGN